jgi:hypothetical protein
MKIQSLESLQPLQPCPVAYIDEREYPACRLVHVSFATCICTVQRHGNLANVDVTGVTAVIKEAESMPASNGAPADQLRAAWRKSSLSNPSGNCVEVASLPDGGIAVRNSRCPSGPALVYTRAEIGAFLAGVKDGEFDDLAR